LTQPCWTTHLLADFFIILADPQDDILREPAVTPIEADKWFRDRLPGFAGFDGSFAAIRARKTMSPPAPEQR
jgi:hypothetical protein